MAETSQVAIVTGAGTGIGREVCMQLSRLGWSLVLVGRTEATLRETALACEGGVGSAEIVVADVGEPSAAGRVAEAARARFGRVDALINNAGYALMQPMADYDDAELETTFAVNAVGPIRFMIRVWELLSATRGRVVNVSSMSTIDPFPGLGVYGAAKAALNRVGAAAEREHGEDGVRVFTVAPGAVETGILRAIVPESMLPSSLTLAPAFVAEVIVACATGGRDGDAGTVITVPSPSA